jgi:hypothetical protein
MLRNLDRGTVVLHKDGDLTFTLNILHKLTDRVDIMYEAAAVLNTINKNLQNFDQATQEARFLDNIKECFDTKTEFKLAREFELDPVLESQIRFQDLEAFERLDD